MKDRIWPFVVGNNLLPIALIVVAAIAFLKFARSTSPIQTTPGSVMEGPTPKYLERIIEKHHYYSAPEGGRFQYLPKEELEKARPGSVSREVMQDNASQVVARTEVPPSRGKTQVDAIRKQEADGTARFRLDYRQLPPPFFDLKREIHGGIYYGVAGENVLEGEIRINPLRIGPVETSVKGRLGLERGGGSINGSFLVGIEY